MMSDGKLWVCFAVALNCILDAKFASAAPQNGIQVATYGQPCHTPRNLPVKIEGPAIRMEEVKTAFVQPQPPQTITLSNAYPMMVQSQAVNQPLLKTLNVPAVSQGNVYGVMGPIAPVAPGVPQAYSTVQFALPAAAPSSQMILPPAAPVKQPPKLLTGLTTKVDKIVVPACD